MSLLAYHTIIHIEIPESIKERMVHDPHTKLHIHTRVLCNDRILGRALFGIPSS